jgi:MFS-type transporter involved in bile tolerance (Atg22 family)
VHALGDAISPFLVGVMDDLTGSLRFGLVAAVGVLALGGGAVLLALPGSQRVAKLKHDAGQG